VERQRQQAQQLAERAAQESARLEQLSQQYAALQTRLEQRRREQVAAAEQAEQAALAAQLAALQVSLERQERIYQQQKAQIEAVQRSIASIERMDMQTYAVFEALAQSFSGFAQLEMQAVEQDGDSYLIRFATDADQEAFAQLTPQQGDRVAMHLELTDMYGETACQPLISNVYRNMEALGIAVQRTDASVDDSDKPNWERVRRSGPARA
jgi:small-conductance mechanosensitive channel